MFCLSQSCTHSVLQIQPAGLSRVTHCWLYLICVGPEQLFRHACLEADALAVLLVTRQQQVPQTDHKHKCTCCAVLRMLLMNQ